MMKASEKECRDAVLMELREERARMELAALEWPRAKAVLDRFEEVKRLARLPRVEVEATPLRRWQLEREVHFDPVAPAEAVSTYMHIEWLSKCLTGELPSAEEVAELAAMAGSEGKVARMLADTAYLVLPLVFFREERLEADERAAGWLLRDDVRPVDLATLIHAAVTMEYAAAHVDGAVAMARLLAVASVLWWAAGQPRRTARAIKVARHIDPRWPLTETMRLALKLRGGPDWMTR